MTRYQRQFGRPLPPEYREVEVCADCSTPAEEGCRCISETTFMAQRIDGQPWTATDNWKVFPEKYDAVH